jgi:hypothetical protein
MKCNFCGCEFEPIKKTQTLCSDICRKNKYKRAKKEVRDRAAIEAGREPGRRSSPNNAGLKAMIEARKNPEVEMRRRAKISRAMKSGRIDIRSTLLSQTAFLKAQTTKSGDDYKQFHRERTASAMAQPGVNDLRIANSIAKTAKLWALRNPQNRDFYFKNLNDFVRNNEGLFSQEEVVWKGKGKGRYCPAIRGLARLSPRRKFPNCSWHGWTWISIHERRFNDGKDLLGREYSEAVIDKLL